MDINKVDRIAAFSHNGQGGNPAGVAICDVMPGTDTMLQIASDIGYSETAFLVKQDSAWRVRYFAPQMEVPFCGHATIAVGAVLAERFGVGEYPLILNDGTISVSAIDSADGRLISLQSPQTRSWAAPDAYIDSILSAFNITQGELDTELPVSFANAGANHLIVPLASRETLAAMDYPFEAVKSLMAEQDLVTINLIWRDSNQRFYARNAFAAGGVVEDPATGAAAAALAGYLRDQGWQGSRSFEILQGIDMGQPCSLLIEYDEAVGSSIKVSGTTYRISL